MIRKTNAQPSSTARNRYRSAHWGIDGGTTYEVDQEGLPDELVQMGDLLEIHVDPGEDSDVFELKFPKGCHLAFAHTEDERLYVICPPDVCRWMATNLWDPRDWKAMQDLGAVAREAGGRQAEYGYPKIEVQPIGEVIAVVYRTHKKGDGVSDYVHEFGDEEEGTGELPVLCVDGKGRLWIAGGAYATPDAGITG